MARAEFSKATKLAAWERSGQRCECYMLKEQTCNRERIVGRPEYHHIVEAALGGSNELDNCAVVSPKCHRFVTVTVSIPTVAKAVRVYEKRAGLRKTKRPFPKRVDAWGKGRE